MSHDTTDTVWRLHGCCEREESIFLGLYFFYGIMIHCFYMQEVFYPFKLLAVFVHEMGHGSAAWLTCGKVKSIKVNLDQSGTAAYSGGIQWVVIPAGYVGGAFWGAAFVALSGSRIGATVAACLVSTALLISLAYVTVASVLSRRIARSIGNPLAPRMNPASLTSAIHSYQSFVFS
jgi:Peptidase M50B-like